MIITPRGLRIRITEPIAFGLMARLYPSVRPVSVLKGAEGIDQLSSLLPLVTATACVLLSLHPAIVFAATLFGFLLACTLMPFVFRLTPGLLSVCEAYTSLAALYTPHFVFFFLALYMNSWPSILVYVAAIAVGGALRLQYAMLRRGIDPPFGPSEWSFVYAYQYYASKDGTGMDIDLTEEEMDIERWGAAYTDYTGALPALLVTEIEQ